MQVKLRKHLIGTCTLCCEQTWASVNVKAASLYYFDAESQGFLSM